MTVVCCVVCCVQIRIYYFDMIEIDTRSRFRIDYDDHRDKLEPVISIYIELYLSPTLTLFSLVAVYVHSSCYQWKFSKSSFFAANKKELICCCSLLLYSKYEDTISHCEIVRHSETANSAVTRSDHCYPDTVIETVSSCDSEL